MTALNLPNNWTPRDYQLPAWVYLQEGGKRLVLVCHRRWGKDDLALHWAATAAHDPRNKPGSYWHMLPEYEQGRRVIWNAVNSHTGKRRIDEAFPKELREKTNDQEMFIRFKNGSTWQVVGSDRYDTLVGAGVAGVTFSEWALADPNAYGFLAPMLAENDGWAAFIYTARGRNHGWDTYQRAMEDPMWFCAKQTALDTPVFTEAALADALKDYVTLYGRANGTALYEQEYLCSFDAAIIGSYYSDELKDAAEDDPSRITNVPIERALPVHTAWDLGFTDSTAIWFVQQVGRELHLVDYFEGNNMGLDAYAKILQDKKYLYGQHYFPHDVQVKELGTGRGRVETLRSLGIEPIVVPVHKIEDGINAVRMIFPRLWIDRTRCKRGLEALRNYRREYDKKAKDYRPRPMHNWASHGSDALRYFAAGFRDSPLRKRSMDAYREDSDSDDKNVSWMGA